MGSFLNLESPKIRPLWKFVSGLLDGVFIIVLYVNDWYILPYFSLHYSCLSFWWPQFQKRFFQISPRVEFASRWQFELILSWVQFVRYVYAPQPIPFRPHYWSNSVGFHILWISRLYGTMCSINPLTLYPLTILSPQPTLLPPPLSNCCHFVHFLLLHHFSQLFAKNCNRIPKWLLSNQ